MGDNRLYISMNKVFNNYNILNVIDFQESMLIYANILTSTLTLLEEKCTPSPLRKPNKRVNIKCSATILHSKSSDWKSK